MTQYAPVFNTTEFEQRGYTSPWFSPDQQSSVQATENRVNDQLDWLAQFLGWNGGNYWFNLASTVSQKRQLLSGSYGVYNSFVVARILSIRNWDETIVIEPIENLTSGLKVFLDYDEYTIQSVVTENDTQVISLGSLPQSFYDQIAANVQLKIDVPTKRSAPFYRPTVGVAGDNSFVCSASGTSLTLSPNWDLQHAFPYSFPTLFAGSIYYFDQPIFLSYTSTINVDIAPQYDSTVERWFLTIPKTLVTDASGLTVFLVWGYSDSTSAVNATLAVKIEPWRDPSDWGDSNILKNFLGTWGNKGGPLPFNFVFDSLSLHGFNEVNSLGLSTFSRVLGFDDLVTDIYDQRTTVDVEPPSNPKLGQSWWNTATGAFAVWYGQGQDCYGWVEVSYRNPPNVGTTVSVFYANVAAFIANANTLPVGTVVEILDITGLSVAENVLGIQGTLTTPGTLILYRSDSSVYWTPSEFGYLTLSDWSNVASLLPAGVPVVLQDATGLGTQSTLYSLTNLDIVITESYELKLLKVYNNTTWEVLPDSVLKYIANSSLSGTLRNGAMWWDYASTPVSTRAASVYVTSPSGIVSLSVLNPGIGLTNGFYPATSLVLQSASGGGGASADITVTGNTITLALINNPGSFYQQGDVLCPDSSLYPGLVGSYFVVDQVSASTWVSINSNVPSASPNAPLNTAVLLFYCDGALLQNGIVYSTADYKIMYSGDSTTAKYTFTYTPLNLTGKTQFPTITMSDNLTTAYVKDITDQVFSGITYYMSPNVYDAESPLRLWKGEALQVVETQAHLAENNFINPLRADINNGPGPENWERYFVRMPLDYGRNATIWQKVALTLQDFAYWGSSIDPDPMECPDSLSEPVIYDELFLYSDTVPDYAYVYSEPYLYSNIAYFDNVESGPYANSGIFPTQELQFDEFTEAQLTEYAPLHNRQADVVSAVGKGYGDWIGEYVNINPCVPLTGFLEMDLLNGGVSPIPAPIWDASIYKIPPTCDHDIKTYSVDANHYKLGYAYFVADASVAEDGFFDVQQKSAWRRSAPGQKSLYLAAG